jgi:Nuclear pore complex assembly
VDPRVISDFVPKIIYALSLASPSHVTRFIRLAKPVLSGPEDEESLSIYIRALCEQNVIEAWLFTRTFPEEREKGEDASKARFIWMILEYCLIRGCSISSSISHRFSLESPADTTVYIAKPRSKELQTLITFPLTSYEQTVLNTYVLRPPSSLPESSLAVLQDLITVRLVHQGKYSDAIVLDRLFVSETAGRVGAGGGGVVAKAAESRRETFRDLMAVLPDVQRRLLELKLDDPQPSSTQTQTEARSQQDINKDLAMSWEDLGGSIPSLSSSIISATPRRAPPPPTPLSASAALRSGKNPKVAVLRAFAHANAASSSRLEGSPSPASSGLRASMSSVGTRSRLSQSYYAETPTRIAPADTPSFNPAQDQNPFASRPRLSATPVQNRSRSLFGVNVSASPAPNPLTISSRGPSTSVVSSWGAYSQQPSAQSVTSNNRGLSSSHLRSTLSSTSQHITSNHTVFQGQQNQPPPLPDDHFADPERIFKPSRALHRTPFAGGSNKAAQGRAMGNPELGQSTITPSKRPRENTESLWRAHSTGSGHVGLGMKEGGDDGDGDVDGYGEAEDDIELEHFISPFPRQFELVRNGNADASDQEADDREAELELTRVDSRDDFPGAFPHDSTASTNGSRGGRSYEADRRALPTWISTAPTPAKKGPPPPSLFPPLNQPTRSGRRSTSTKSSAQSQSQTHQTRHGQKAAASSPSPPPSASSALQVPQQQQQPQHGKPSSRTTSKVRASSVVSDTGDEMNATSGPTLRRSSRLSATPAPLSTSPERKNKKLRSSSSPPGPAKVQQRKGRGSAPPPPTRRTRRQASVLDNVDE